ncbi:hypothetical protein AWY96_00310 [Serratia plymuthica]|nr:hypothetical protein AWY96_00310 [Serratia plymuthica]
MLFEKMTIQNRIKQQMALLPKKVASRLYEDTYHKKINNDPTKKPFQLIIYLRMHALLYAHRN